MVTFFHPSMTKFGSEPSEGRWYLYNFCQIHIWIINAPSGFQFHKTTSFLLPMCLSRHKTDRFWASSFRNRVTFISDIRSLFDRGTDREESKPRNFVSTSDSYITLPLFLPTHTPSCQFGSLSAFITVLTTCEVAPTHPSLHGPWHVFVSVCVMEVKQDI